MLFAANALIAWRFLKLSFGPYFFSIEGVFIDIAEHRLVSTPFSNQWIDLWLLGIPAEHIYVPLVHWLVLIVRDLLRIDAVRAYHLTTGILFCLGPVAVFLSLLLMRASSRVALLTSTLFTTLSPAVLFSSNIFYDLDGNIAGQRLRVLTFYGEGPHVSSLVILPFAVAFLYRSAQERSLLNRFTLPAILFTTLLIACNTPGTMAFLVFASANAVISQGRLRSLVPVAIAFLLSLALVPVPYWLAVLGNSAGMHPEAIPASRSILFRIAIFLGLALLASAVSRLCDKRTGLFLLAGAAFALILTTSRLNYFDVLPQGARLHIELELCVCYVLACAFWNAYQRASPCPRVAMIAALCFLLAIGLGDLRALRRSEHYPVDLTSRVEFQAAQWANRHLDPAAGRVFVSGSTALWFNVFSKIPITEGCCAQGVTNDIGTRLRYIVNQSTSPEDVVRAIDWAVALGVQALILPSPSSNDAYRSTMQPEKFEPHLHREDSPESLFVYRFRARGTVRFRIPRAKHGPDRGDDDRR